jgi:hypothetical protein
MISGRTKVLLFGASLPLLIFVGVVIWTLAPYYYRQRGNSFDIINFHFHFTPWFWIWVFVLAAGLISFVYDKVAVRK